MNKCMCGHANKTHAGKYYGRCQHKAGEEGWCTCLEYRPAKTKRRK